MPTLTLKVSPPQTADRHHALASALTRITAETLGKRADVTAVLIDDVDPQRWHIGGRALQQASAWLEICITAGTNTAEQKAAFIADAHAELQRQLAGNGTLAPASYVIVHELPASDWGYGGVTQRARQLARSVAAA
ncbi:tautomerase family protein [Variovorax sp. YR752]|uniref:tautomerase family protein n=1 Tax=Variovorax sp. YR752 TaxID=1884383 RepID=UPI003137EF38